MTKKTLLFVIIFVGLVAIYFFVNMNVGKREPIIITSYGSYQEMTLDDLITDSDVIAIGRLATIHPSHWNTADGLLPEEITVDTITPDSVIFTDFNFQAEQIIKGDINQKVILIRTLGGVVGDDQMIYDSVLKEIKAENNYLLFLYQDKRPLEYFDEKHYWVNGGYQGMYQVVDKMAVSNRDEWQLEELIVYIQKILSETK